MLKEPNHKLHLITILYIIYFYSSIPFSIVYFTDLTNTVTLFFTIFNTLLKTSITLGAFYYIYKDFHTNHFIENNNSSKLFLIFFIFCIISSIINGNGFSKFNNIYFIIHSALLFYLSIQNNYKDENYHQLIFFVIFSIILATFLISLTTILIFISNKTGLTQYFSSKSLQSYLYQCAPVNRRWVTILNNSNTYGHLVSYSFILSTIPLVNVKKLKNKMLIIIMVLINYISLLFSGSKGALVSLSIGILLGVIIILINLYKKNNKKIFYFLTGLILIIIIIGTTIISTSNNLDSLNHLNSNILRFKTISKGTGRFDIWKNLFNLPILIRPFGYSDSYLIDYFNSLSNFDYNPFLNNSGRSHNMYLQVLVSFGTIGFILFIFCLLKTFTQIINNYKLIDQKNKLIFFVFLIQFIVILISGTFEQLPIFNMSAHSLLFMFVWANLLTISEIQVGQS